MFALYALAALSFAPMNGAPLATVPLSVSTRTAIAPGVIAAPRMELHDRDSIAPSQIIKKAIDKFGCASKTALDKVTVEAMKLWALPERVPAPRDLAETAWEDHLLPEPLVIRSGGHTDLACWEDRLLPKTSGLLPHTQPERLDLQLQYRLSSSSPTFTSTEAPKHSPRSLGGWEDRLLPSREYARGAVVRDLSDVRWEDRLLP